MINYIKSWFNQSKTIKKSSKKPHIQGIPKDYGLSQNNQSGQKPHPILICYAEQDKKPIPLQCVHYFLKVQTGIIIVEVQQQYSTETYENPIDLEYLFVINRNATVTKMMVEIGDEQKIGIIKEKEEAKIEYAEGIKQGKTMAYSDQDEQIPEIKRVKVGLLAPNKSLKITFEYAQPLEVFLNKYWKVEVSPLIDPTYFGQNNKIKFGQYNKEQHVLRKYVQLEQFLFNYKQDISVEIDIDSIITSFKSSTHQMITSASKFNVKQGQQLDQSKKLLLILQDTPENYQPNKQFILLFSTDDINLPRAILTHINNDALLTQKYCATLTLIPKFNEVSLDDAYQQYLDGITIPLDQKINRANYLFFLDRSGSMEGDRIEKAKQALILFLKSLPDNSCFNIVSFGSKYKTLWNQAKEYSQETLDQAIKFVSNLTADMGGTEIFKPLRGVVYNKGLIEKCKKRQMAMNVFLLTDGIVDAQPIINLISTNKCAEIRIYSLGIGQDCIEYLMKRTSELGNGKYHIIKDDDDLNAKVIDLLEDSITLYLKEFSLETNAENVYSIIPAPDSITCLKKNQELMIQVIFSNEQLNNNIEFNLTCYDPQEQKPIKYNICLNLEQSSQNEYFHKISAHRFINYLEESLKQQEPTLNQVDYIKDQITFQDIINMSLQYQILSAHTAFVCEVCNLEDQFQQQIKQKVFINQNTMIKKMEQEKQHIRQREFQSTCMKKSKKTQQISDQIQDVQEMLKCNIENILSRTDSLSELESQCFYKKTEYKQYLKIKEQLDQDEQFEEDNISSLEQEWKKLQPQLYTIKKVQNQVLTSKISYQEIVQFAQANGRFSLSIQYQTKLNISVFENKMKFSETVLITLLCLFYLELFCAQEKSAWLLIFRKGVDFLQKNGVQYKDEKNQQIEQYRKLFPN